MTRLAALATSQVLQAGGTAVFNLPAGAGRPTASAVTISMTATGGTPAYTLTVTSVADGGGGTSNLTTSIPALTITAPTLYQFVASGTADSKFVTESLSVLVQPAPALTAVSPATARAGQTLDVTLTGVATNWVNGTTTASFGAGISVGGANAGVAGPVTVSSATAAVAHLIVLPTAIAGTRDVTVTTGTQSQTLPSAFQVTPAAPVASAGGPYTGTAGSAVSFSAAASSDPGGLALSYAWDFGDSSAGTGVSPSHTYAAAGTYKVSVTVTNSAGLATPATSTAVIAAAPQPPVANAGGPYSGTAGTAVTFSGAASTDPKNEVLTYAWTFGDGGTATGISPTHTYASAGTFTVSLIVTNTDKLSNTATATATITAAPQPPVANAGGPYSGTAGTAVAFNGAGSSDPKNEVLTYAWAFGDGGTATGVSPTHTYAAAGTFTVSLVVTNTDKLSNTATTTATIAVAPQSPVANAGGPYSGTAGTAVTFSGAGSTDPKNEALTYTWTFGDGGTATGISPTHTYASAGTFTVSLVVTNTDKLSNTATTTATVAAAPQSPVANAGGPYSGTAGTAVAFNGAGSSDPKNETLSYAWTFGDGGNATGVSPTHTYSSAGTFTVSLVVTNTDKLSNTATATATITAAPQSPVANAGGPYSGTAGTALTFSGAASTDPKNETLTYAWAFGDGGTATGVSPTHTYAAAGTFTVSVVVTNTDKLSNTATATATITAAPKPPVANAGGPYSGTAGTAISFNGGASTDPQNETLTYAWSFGDGATATGPAPTHIYASAGTYTATLTVTNTDKSSNGATASVTVAAAPQAPVANAGGPYTGTAGTSVTFSGAGSSDPKNETLTYAWAFGDGGTATGVSPTHTYAGSGTFTVTLTVTNTDKLSAMSSTTATLAAAPQPPVANAGGPYTGTAGTLVNFSGSASSDPKGETLSYLWTFGDGTSATTVAPTHTYAASGTFTVTLTVTNSDSLSASMTTTATIAAAPQAPTANTGGPYAGTAGVALSFNGSASSDPKNEVLTFAWNFGDGGTATGATPAHTYATNGTFTVMLTVTNTDNVSATASATATVAAAPQAPSAVVGGPYSGTAGSPVAFSGSGTDPKGEALTYAWNFGDGGTASGATPSHTFAAAGTYTVTLTATNTDKLSSSASTTATIAAAPQAPVANAGGPYTGTAGTALTVSGSGSSDPKGEMLTYSWNFGDGSTGTGISPTHTYATQGSYTARLTVTNTDNLSASATTSVAVSAAPQAPVASAGGPYTGTSGVAITFNGTGSSDPQGQTLTYAWTFGDGATATGPSPTHAYTASGMFTVSLTVTNASSLASTATTTATISAPAAQPPVAVPGGPYTGTTGQEIVLNGSRSSDPRGEALTYLWNFGDGATATSAMPVHTYTSAGTFTVTLTVTNTDGGSGSATTTATITGPPVAAPQVFSGGPYNGVSGQAISFDGSRSYDPNTTTAATAGGVTLSWNFGDGTPAATGPQPVHTYATGGSYTITLTGTTPTGSATTTTTAAIDPGAPTTGAPTAVATGPSAGAYNTPVSFDGSKSSDPNGLPLTYIWVFGDGTSSNAASPTHSYTIPGTFTVMLTVSNGANLGVASTNIVIAPPVSAGAAQANAGGPYTVPVNQVLRVDGSKTTNPSSHGLTYTWDFGDGTSATGLTPTHIYSAQGTYTVSLNVLEGTTASTNSTTKATVGAPPAETLTANAGGPYSESTGNAVVFDGSNSVDNLNANLTYTWDFGDGATGSGITPTHTYTTAGSFTAKLTVTSGSITSQATAKVGIAQAITVTIATPTANTLFGANAQATVSGTVSGSGLTVMVNGVTAQVSGTSFTATGVALREGVNLLVATATDGNGGVGTGSVSVNMDATAPVVSITMPAANAVLSATQTSVAGLINDIVTGTIGSNDVTVTVNGTPAQVSNRSYLLASLPLVPGSNMLKVVAVDRVGNTSTTTEMVTVLSPTAQLSLHMVSGDGQSAAVHTLLAQPLVAQLLSSTGAPVAGRPITFTVSRSDGMVESMPMIAQSLSATTDATGRASVLFQLGSRAGLGVNQVTASTPGAAGGVTFSETSTTSAATQIHIVRGDAQRGLLGSALPEAFQTIVQDAFGNPVAGAQVTFSSVMGGGTLDQTSVSTDSNGKASASLTLGQQEGINNYVVQADVAGDTGSPLTFHASGYSAGPVANTSVSGIVLDNAGMAVSNATVTLANTGLTTVTDVTGKFTITGAPVGTVTLTVDGSTATSSHTFPFLSFVLIDLPGQNNALTKPVYLPFIDVDDAQTVGGSDPVTLTIAGAPGVAFTIPANAVTFPDGSKVGKMSLSQVKSDLVPMLPSNGTSPNLVWTLQPAGTRFSTPVQVTLPNTQGLPAGMVSEFFQYDHDLEQFVSAGTMHVSADGSVMVSDPGFGLTKAGWGHGPVVPDPTTCVRSCQSTTCTTQTASGCGCSAHYNDGANCGLEPTDQCHFGGTCLRGGCVAKAKPDTAPCMGPLFCSTYECKSGSCAGTPIQDQDIPADPTQFGSTLQIESSFGLVGGKIQAFLDKYGGKTSIQPAINAPSYKETLTCCEAKKLQGQLIESVTLSGQINVVSPEFTVYVGTVPLGIVFPQPVGTQGVTLQVKGGLGPIANYEKNQCTGHDCWGGGLIASIGAEGKIRAGVDAFNLYGTIGASITGTLVINCDRVVGNLTWSGIEFKGGVQVGMAAFPFPAATVIGPYTLFVRVEISTGAVTYGVQ